MQINKKKTADYDSLFDDFPEDGVDPFQKIDISIESVKGTGQKTIDFISYLLNTVPMLKPVVLILKKLFAANNLNVTFTGGINSYSTIMMCGAFLSNYGVFIPNLGTAVTKILDFYAHQFDNRLSGICYNGSMLYFYKNNKNRTYFRLPSEICEENLMVMDPLNPLNNLACNLCRYGEIRKCLETALKKLTTTCCLFDV